MKVSIKWNKLFFIFLFEWFANGLNPVWAQQTFPLNEGECVYYNFTMTSSRAEIRGLCILKLNGKVINASIMNDFGATFIDYSYQVKKLKVKLHYVVGQLDKWYIRRVLKRDLKKVMIAMYNKETTYCDSKHRLTYTFIVNHDIEK